MKVSASPFEAPIGTSRSGEVRAGESRLAARESAPHLVQAPAAPANVRASLDQATKEALKGIVALVKKKPNATSEDSTRDEAQDSSSERFEPNDLQAKDRSVRPHRSATASASFRPIETQLLLDQASLESAIARVQTQFEKIKKLRGMRVYSENMRSVVSAAPPQGESLIDFPDGFNLFEEAEETRETSLKRVA